MAGSYKHIVNEKNEFIDVCLIDNLGDASEALGECYDLIQILSGGDKSKIFEAYREIVEKTNPEHAEKMTEEEYWSDC